MKITLPIYFNTKETSEADRARIDINLSDCEIKDVNFYHIDAVSDYEDEHNNKIISSIHASGSRWICPLTKEEVDEKITSFRLN